MGCEWGRVIYLSSSLRGLGFRLCDRSVLICGLVVGRGFLVLRTLFMRDDALVFI